MTVQGRRVAGTALAAVVGVAVAVWSTGPEERAAGASHVRFLPRHGATAPIPPPPTPQRTGWEASADAVRGACGLPVETVCDHENRCVSVLQGPDLDWIGGWAALALQSPRFVASAALRDLGVPVGDLPCGRAIDGLTGGVGVVSVEQPDGTEVWCAAQPGAEDLCDPAAAAIGAPTGFAEADLRQLSFDR